VVADEQNVKRLDVALGWLIGFIRNLEWPVVAEAKRQLN
jgi:hypothetical protein